ncbi:hypothetical protein K5X82_00510 [Halosquirtibacter xylanolyticus]|uniref:hypothetical protein n=1 Tax=Halosquirtibacter xylanolyticus TaxID=3374599 RepID=UPI00374A636D|nr:hypothetical protein K5X82_00510 [Prolixibacteraceae bacterium]
MKLFSLVLVAFLAFACNNTSKKNCNGCDKTEKCAEAKKSCCDKEKEKKKDSCCDKKKSVSSEVYTLESLMSNAESLVNKQVQVKGNVLHTCKHSGRRCFLAGDDEKVSIRVEAGGKIKGFNQELVGSEIIVTGMMKERRLTKEYIEQYEHELKEKQHKEDGSAESCAAENNNLTKMRSWMKEHNKDYYAIYFIQGEDYETVQ